MSNTMIIKYSKKVIFLVSRLQRADGQATYFTVINVFCQQKLGDVLAYNTENIYREEKNNVC